MKKLTALLLCLSMLIVPLFGCQKSNQDAADPNDIGAANQEEAKSPEDKADDKADQNNVDADTKEDGHRNKKEDAYLMDMHENFSLPNGPLSKNIFYYPGNTPGDYPYIKGESKYLPVKTSDIRQVMSKDPNFHNAKRLRDDSSGKYAYLVGDKRVLINTCIWDYVHVGRIKSTGEYGYILEFARLMDDLGFQCEYLSTAIRAAGNDIGEDTAFDYAEAKQRKLTDGHCPASVRSKRYGDKSKIEAINMHSERETSYVMSHIDTTYIDGTRNRYGYYYCVSIRPFYDSNGDAATLSIDGSDVGISTSLLVITILRFELAAQYDFLEADAAVAFSKHNPLAEYKTNSNYYPINYTAHG